MTALASIAAEQRPNAARAAELLEPYVPRLLVEWLVEAPETTSREAEGSLAYVDISGFTALTERLARKGKIGAEEMTGHLDALFGELILLAEDEGADLLKWGGDAVFLWFAGEEHPVRACRTAFTMQSKIASAGRLRTSSGVVQLRMSVGIHSGTFHFFLVGDVHRELLIAGPGASATALMEATAEAGEVAVTRATAAHLDPHIVVAERGAAILVAGPTSGSGGRGERAVRAPLPDLSQVVPAALRPHLLADQHVPEHRHATMAFVDFRRADELLEHEGTEGLARALDICMAVVQRAALAHQVTFLETDVSYDGVRALLVAGAPTSAGDDEERMLRTARSIATARAPLAVRIGINSGRIFAGDFGPPFRRTYSIKGDAVNLAARVGAKASEGQILATEATVARSRTVFATEALAPFAVKGKEQPVQAFVIGAPTRGRTARVAAAPLVGRDRELGLLLEILSAARQGAGRIVEFIGEPGIGKSRLLEALEARAIGFDVLTSAAEEYESTTPYFPFRGLLRRALGIAEDANAAEAGRILAEAVSRNVPHLVPWLPFLASVVDAEAEPTAAVEELDERFRRVRLEEVTLELLELLFAGPTLFVFEDVHWFDEASSDLLLKLTHALQQRPWLVVVTRRPGEAGFRASAADSTTRIELRALDPEDASALVEAATENAPLPPHEAAALAERSGGNPLFLTELLAAARAAGGVYVLPESVEGLLTTQIDRLAPADRMVLRHASVLGTTFSVDLLQAPLAEEQPLLDAAVWERLAEFVTHADGTVRFRHALIRDAAYEALPYRLRRDLHGRAGETIEQMSGATEAAAEILSLHFFHAQRYDKAWRYARVAGDRARAIYANAEASAFYERALHAARRLRSLRQTDVANVWEALGDVRVSLGEFNAAGEAFTHSRRRAPANAVEQARLALKQALIPWRLGRYPQALRWIRRGLRMIDGVAGGPASEQRARLYAWQAVIRQKQGQAGEAIEWCRRAIDEAERSGARDALAHAYQTLDWAYIALGRSDDAVYGGRALAIYEELGHRDRQAASLNNLGANAHFQGRWDEALALYDQARETWEKAGDRWAPSFPMANSATILSDQGRFEEAEQLFRRALRIARASRSGARVADVAQEFGRLAARAGRFEEAHALLDDARADYESQGDRTEVLATEARIAESLVLEGRAEEAIALAQETLRRAAALDGTYNLVPMLYRVLGTALMQAGRPADAREALEAGVREARLKGADYELALALDALVTLVPSNGEHAESLATERSEILGRLGVIRLPEIPLSLGGQAAD